MFLIAGNEITNIQVATVFSSVDVLGGGYIHFQLSEDKKMIFFEWLLRSRNAYY